MIISQKMNHQNSSEHQQTTACGFHDYDAQACSYLKSYGCQVLQMRRTEPNLQILPQGIPLHLMDFFRNNL